MNPFRLPIIIPVVTVLVVAGCGGPKRPDSGDPPPIPVTTYTAKSGEAAYYDTYPATVTPLNQVEIRAEVSGYITGIFFKDGQQVHKGEKLYEIDQQRFKAAYDQALANLNVAKANLAKAQQDADRYRDLAKHDAVARQTLEHSLADLNSAKMQVAAAQANVNDVGTNLRYSVIDAPFDGTVGISQVKLGSVVSAGQTLLNTISSDNPIGVDCAVEEKLIPRFSKMLESKIPTDDSTFAVVLPDQSIYEYRGRLTVMDRAVDPETGTIKVRVVFPNPGDELRAGMTCDLRVQNVTSSQSVLIPYRAVVEQMGEYFVYVVRGNRVSQQRVHLGMSIRDMVVVNDGLQPGEQIVSDGVEKLRDNAVVAIAPIRSSGIQSN